MKICPRLFLYILIFLKIFCKNHGIIQINIRHNCIIYICHIRLQGKHIYRLFPLKEIPWFYLVQQKHIIIKIDEAFR